MCNIVIFYLLSNTNKRVENTTDSGEGRAWLATNLHCDAARRQSAGKRSNSYFDIRTVGLLLHNNIRKVMAVACPMSVPAPVSWADGGPAIGSAGRLHHTIC